jgi:hypothetical protein
MVNFLEQLFKNRDYFAELQKYGMSIIKCTKRFRKNAADLNLNGILFHENESLINRYTFETRYNQYIGLFSDTFNIALVKKNTIKKIAHITGVGTIFKFYYDPENETNKYYNDTLVEMCNGWHFVITCYSGVTTTGGGIENDTSMSLTEKQLLIIALKESYEKKKNYPFRFRTDTIVSYIKRLCWAKVDVGDYDNDNVDEGDLCTKYMAERENNYKKIVDTLVNAENVPKLEEVINNQSKQHFFRAAFHGISSIEPLNFLHCVCMPNSWELLKIMYFHLYGYSSIFSDISNIAVYKNYLSQWKIVYLIEFGDIPDYVINNEHSETKFNIPKFGICYGYTICLIIEKCFGGKAPSFLYFPGGFWCIPYFIGNSSNMDKILWYTYYEWLNVIGRRDITHTVALPNAYVISEAKEIKDMRKRDYISHSVEIMNFIRLVQDRYNFKAEDSLIFLQILLDSFFGEKYNNLTDYLKTLALEDSYESDSFDNYLKSIIELHDEIALPDADIPEQCHLASTRTEPAFYLNRRIYFKLHSRYVYLFGTQYCQIIRGNCVDKFTNGCYIQYVISPYEQYYTLKNEYGACDAQFKNYKIYTGIEIHKVKRNQAGEMLIQDTRRGGLYSTFPFIDAPEIRSGDIINGVLPHLTEVILTFIYDKFNNLFFFHNGKVIYVDAENRFCCYNSRYEKYYYDIEGNKFWSVEDEYNNDKEILTDMQTYFLNKQIPNFYMMMWHLKRRYMYYNAGGESINEHKYVESFIANKYYYYDYTTKNNHKIYYPVKTETGYDEKEINVSSIFMNFCGAPYLESDMYKKMNRPSDDGFTSMSDNLFQPAQEITTLNWGENPMPKKNQEVINEDIVEEATEVGASEVVVERAAESTNVAGNEQITLVQPTTDTGEVKVDADYLDGMNMADLEQLLILNNVPIPTGVDAEAIKVENQADAANIIATLEHSEKETEEVLNAVEGNSVLPVIETPNDSIAEAKIQTIESRFIFHPPDKGERKTEGEQTDTRYRYRPVHTEEEGRTTQDVEGYVEEHERGRGRGRGRGMWRGRGRGRGVENRGGREYRRRSSVGPMYDSGYNTGYNLGYGNRSYSGGNFGGGPLYDNLCVPPPSLTGGNVHEEIIVVPLYIPKGRGEIKLEIVESIDAEIVLDEVPEE